MFLFFIFFFTVPSCYGFGQFKAADQMEGNFRFAHHDCLFNDLMEQILVEGFCRLIFIQDALQFLEFIKLLVTFFVQSEGR